MGFPSRFETYQSWQCRRKYGEAENGITSVNNPPNVTAFLFDRARDAMRETSRPINHRFKLARLLSARLINQ